MPGPRLLVHVEGQTEEGFVNEVLGPYLVGRGYDRVSARIVGNPRMRQRRGGIRGWDSVRNDIVRHLQGDRGCIATTMVDYYALPATGNRAWPGRGPAASLPTSSSRAGAIEAALLADIGRAMGPAFDPNRFEPFIAMHEFEGLLFSDCELLAAALGEPDLAPKLLGVRAAFGTPEDINDSPHTAPSKRLISLMESVDKRYDKVMHGFSALDDIGLPKVRAECPHFDRWLCRLESRITPTPQPLV